ncbi:hypothetical protein GG804_11330 [Sphingomonas histidinilytica]|jgi:hypothetical protein|uniref:Uncharacterized protein n=1 Tax=Rhizorhabdus histidinilytica TaxID=439228 RepID=A0A1T5BIU3_9SPHN|nr:hypothetical protein [Rhizorhabdus histidinilytica]MBO9377359.1 hypothetical protein [Rhizorhabdus histidinilytica]QEH77587.1 hypothetical protein EIK56_05165 [Sphingomonas sp. C8-2]SKB47168.1 hypothetical protein SAMN06295920_10351 [Rhizorhabdus histidinilytica]
MTELTLPTAFADLAPWLDWALPTADGRQAKRLASTSETLRRFYDAVLPRLEAILAEVDKHPLGQLPPTLRPLYDIALSLAEVAPHIELYDGAVGVPYAFEEGRFIAVHGDQPTWSTPQPMMTPAP